MKQIQIIGNLGKDAELLKIKDTDYLSFSVAVTEKVKGEDETTWFNCVKYGSNENLKQYLTKGVKVFIQGNLNAKISDNNGKIFLNLNVNVSNIKLIGSKQENSVQVITESAPIHKEEVSDLPF